VAGGDSGEYDEKEQTLNDKNDDENSADCTSFTRILTADSTKHYCYFSLHQVTATVTHSTSKYSSNA